MMFSFGLGNSSLLAEQRDRKGKALNFPGKWTLFAMEGRPSMHADDSGHNKIGILDETIGEYPTRELE
jgi:hypothetical protein